MNHFPGTSWGKPRNDSFDPHSTFPIEGTPIHSDQDHFGNDHDSFTEGVQRTLNPIMTGTSVIALKFDKGIIMAADTLGSYGSLARFRDIKRLQQVGSSTVIGAGGDLSDWQQIQHMLNKLMLRETTLSDTHTLTTPQIYEYLGRVLYSRRSKFDPLWSALLVGGFSNGESFLGYVDLLGTTYSAPTLATGFGNHLAIPLLRKAYEDKEKEGKMLDETEARKIIEKCMKVLFYRDARSLNRFQISIVTEDGVKIEEPRSLDTEWSFAEGLRGYGSQTK